MKRRCDNCTNWVCEKVILENKNAGIPYDSIGSCPINDKKTEGFEVCDKFKAKT